MEGIPGQQQSAKRGSGLALIICHEMITAMNGKLWAANNEDGGASFHYRLPAASARDN
ncbi:ATP-binding protein [Parapedobacter composti]|uniref:ATP-binding protein n=1 Tax=Parapedobacter composti TaxID=623281 RepID=UPI00148166BC|nr:ATP-binding protein [Parapedobacter composti]